MNRALEALEAVVDGLPPHWADTPLSESGPATDWATFTRAALGDWLDSSPAAKGPMVRWPWDSRLHLVHLEWTQWLAHRLLARCAPWLEAEGGSLARCHLAVGPHYLPAGTVGQVLMVSEDRRWPRLVRTPRRITVRYGAVGLDTEPLETLATVVHEVAHAGAPHESHGRRWRACVRGLLRSLGLREEPVRTMREADTLIALSLAGGFRAGWVP